MSKNQAQKGFTLVELAISLVIIGLLIGGMLKGRVLMQSARISATVSQMSAIEAGVTTFRSTYNQLPGDMPNAQTRLPNCTNCSTASLPPALIGDGIIGQTAWTGTAMQSVAISGSPTDVQAETMLFWAELNNADLLTGISWNGGDVALASIAFGNHMPAARVGGGFGVTSVNSARPAISPLGTPSQGVVRTGTTLLLNSTPTGNLATTAGTAVLDPSTALQIDTKLDDGLPTTGRAQAFGYTRGNSTDGCFVDNGAAPNPPPTYNESLSGLDCGIAYQIK